MIMPCMNSTSACDGGGSVALVEGGSTLLGFPGAPGCTTTGASAGWACCVRALGENELAGALAAISMASSAAAFLEIRGLRKR
jgi:hypothetical protein